MSKTIEPAKELSDFDREYLIARGKNPDDYIIGGEPEDASSRTPTEEPPGGVGLDDDGGARPTVDDNRNAAESDGDDEDDDDVPPYSEWTVKELIAEVESRDGLDVPQKPRKDALIELLEGDDAQSAG